MKILAEGGTLSRTEAGEAMHLLMKGGVEPEEIAGFLLGLRSRGETVDELTGFTDVMRKYAVPVSIEDENAIDIVGTGGDGAKTFNISTAAAFVCAGAGVTVAKHGNRAVSSKSGASDVLAALGVRTNLRKKGVEACLSEVGISFIFAPFFHPSLKNVMPTRRKLGVRTFFNILGPLCNPAGVQRMLVGAFSDQVAKQMAEIMSGLGATHVVTVHGFDGLDEITLTGPTHIYEGKSESGTVTKSVFEPGSLGLPVVEPAELQGGDAEENARIIQNVFSGQEGAARDVVLLNAAYALYVSGKHGALDSALEAATRSIDSGAAGAKLGALVEMTQSLPVETD